MSWFWGKADTAEKSNDPYAKLDPSLREYLDKESPSKHEDTKPKAAPTRGRTSSTAASSSAPASSAYSAQLGLDTRSVVDANNQHAPPAPERTDGVPPESLFPDGRYAHLWATYRPQAAIEASGKSDADRLADVVAAYNDRKAAVGRAAIANCVEEQLAEKACLTGGTWRERATMCRAQNRAFHRCFNVQSRFLTALGYLAAERGAAEDERIEMHADKLYHEMLAREAAAAAGRAEGQEGAGAAAAALPTLLPLPPLIQAESTAAALGEDSAWARARRRAVAEAVERSDGSAPPAVRLSDLPPRRQDEIRKRIAGMTPEEQELELQLVAAETRAQREYADLIQARVDEERVHRAERRERGKETVGDTIKRLWGWDK